MAELRSEQGNDLPLRGRGIYHSAEGAARAWGRARGIAGRAGGWLFSAAGERLVQGWGALARQLQGEGKILSIGGGRWRLAAGEEQVQGAVGAEEQPVNVVEQEEGAAVELDPEVLVELPPPLPPPPAGEPPQALPEVPGAAAGDEDEDEAKTRAICDLARACGGLTPALRVRLREQPLERLRAMLAAGEGPEGAEAPRGVAVHVQPPGGGAVGYGQLGDALEALGVPARCGLAVALIQMGAITLRGGRFEVAPQEQPIGGAVPVPIDDDADTTPYSVHDRRQRVRRPRQRRTCPPGGVRILERPPAPPLH